MSRDMGTVKAGTPTCHANDWHTGLVPALLASTPVAYPRTVFTIHNLAFQGNFPLDVAQDLGLPPTLLESEGAEFFGQLSFLKAGIRYGDRLTTVSPSYAREILTPEYGAGLDGILRSRAATYSASSMAWITRYGIPRTI